MAPGCCAHGHAHDHAHGRAHAVGAAPAAMGTTPRDEDGATDGASATAGTPDGDEEQGGMDAARFARANGNALFRKGKYAEAMEQYAAATAMLVLGATQRMGPTPGAP